MHLTNLALHPNTQSRFLWTKVWRKLNNKPTHITHIYPLFFKVNLILTDNQVTVRLNLLVNNIRLLVE